MGWLIAIGIIIALALMPLGLHAKYDASGPLAAFIIGPVRLRLYPRPAKEKRGKPGKKSSAQKPAQKEKAGGSVTDFLPLVHLVLGFLEGFRTKLRINNLRFKLILGGGDPCDLALNYGKGWAALGNFMPLLERFFVIKNRELEVQCDFTADRTTIIAGADLTIRLWQLIALVSTHGLKIAKEYFSIMKIRKGGAKT